MSVLYISYDGLLEPLGESQVLRYLERLASHHRITLVSFEKREDWKQAGRRQAMERRVEVAGIRWVPLRYHKRPSALATAWDIARGIFIAAWLAWREQARVVHARSYVPAVIALASCRLLSLRFLFDMRGFWADERVDGGLWQRESRIYAVAKWFERQFLVNADSVVCLTRAAAEAIEGFDYLRHRTPSLHVIPTCVDLDLFHPAQNTDPSNQAFTLGYVGSVGTWYLFDEALTCFKLLRERVPRARLRVLSHGDHAYIRERIAMQDIDPGCVTLESSDPAGVAAALRSMDAGVFFYKPAWSRIATAPTRLGEFLATGLPCLCNTGVGDVESILREDAVGVTVNGFSDEGLRQGVTALLELAGDPHIAARCRESAVKRFSLADGVAAYERIYQSLQAPTEHSRGSSGQREKQ